MDRRNCNRNAIKSHGLFKFLKKKKKKKKKKKIKKIMEQKNKMRLNK